jgi:hypothetical protein
MTQDRAQANSKLPAISELFKSVLKARDYEFASKSLDSHSKCCELPKLELVSVDKLEGLANFRVSATSGGKAITVFARPVGNPITLKDVGAPRLIARGKVRDGVFTFTWRQPRDMDYVYLYAIEMSTERTLRRSQGVMLKV